MRGSASLWLLVAGLPGLAAACAQPAPSPSEIVDRAWRAHELVVAAGERASSCAVAGAAMQTLYLAHRAELADAVALDRDRDRLAEATAYLEQHADRYADLDTRMAALADRCAGEPLVTAVFAAMDGDFPGSSG